MKSSVQPIILSGGSGTRLWPLSRKAYPKQFLNLIGETSLFQQTCNRLSGPLFLAPSILANNDHRFIVAEQMKEIGIEPASIILEPVGRNTAPAALIAALNAAKDDEDRLLLLLPSDHLIQDEEAFANTIASGIDEAKAGKIITFGIQPDKPHTGYGYIKTNGAVKGAVTSVSSFVEKPNLEKAKKYFKDSSFFWNAGIFLFSAKTMIKAFEEHAPGLMNHCRAALEKSQKDLDFIRLDQNSYAHCENISLDYAIMERAKNVGCVAFTSSWSDLGSWAAVSEVGKSDANGNNSQGDVMFEDSNNCYGHSSDGSKIAMVGLENVIAVTTKDAVLVISKDKSEDVKQIINRLNASNSDATIYHRKVYRPWGWYEGLEKGERFQVKCLMVKPGEILSLQSHHHRSEHWVVVNGTAKVTIDDDVKILSENESVYIPLGAKHRLENPGQIPALLIEVQSGSYLGEDDIVRYEDVYGRS